MLDGWARSLAARRGSFYRVVQRFFTVLNMTGSRPDGLPQHKGVGDVYRVVAADDVERLTTMVAIDVSALRRISLASWASGTPLT